MSIRQVNFATGEYYHLYNRGNSKQIIFRDDQDHRYFMNLLKIMNNKCRSKSGVTKESGGAEDMIISIGAYCLMPNHFHILIKQEKDEGVSLFMQKIATAYVMYYNKKYKRTGALFEGKFKSKYAGEDRYLKYLFSYIHLNPLKISDENWKEKVKFSSDVVPILLRYPYSSFQEYFSFIFDLVDRGAFPDYFPNSQSFSSEIISWFQLH